jgi:chorismate mutase
MKTLQELRAEVDQIDIIIIEQLARRNYLSSIIGFLKLQEKQEIHDPAREEELKNKHASLAKSYNLDPLFIERLFNVILQHSKKLQKKSKQDMPPTSPCPPSSIADFF